MALKLYSLKMLGTESEFSICVSHALEIWNSVLPSASAMRWLNSATSRVVIHSLVRMSFNWSLGESPTAMPHSTASGEGTAKPSLQRHVYRRSTHTGCERT